MKITDRYASAVRSSNLKSAPETYMSDTDTLGAYGIADRRLSAGVGHFGKHPLAVPLERLLTGDKTAAKQITRLLEDMIRNKANSMRIRMTQRQAYDMSRAVLSWFRSPACQACGGHGFKIIKGAPTLSDKRCHPCNGTGKFQLEMLFREELRGLVRWGIAKVEEESGMAGAAAMRALAPKLEF